MFGISLSHSFDEAAFNMSSRAYVGTMITPRTVGKVTFTEGNVQGGGRSRRFPCYHLGERVQ